MVVGHHAWHMYDRRFAILFMKLQYMYMKKMYLVQHTKIEMLCYEVGDQEQRAPTEQTGKLEMCTAKSLLLSAEFVFLCNRRPKPGEISAKQIEFSTINRNHASNKDVVAAHRRQSWRSVSRPAKRTACPQKNLGHRSIGLLRLNWDCWLSMGRLRVATSAR